MISKESLAQLVCDLNSINNTSMNNTVFNAANFMTRHCKNAVQVSGYNYVYAQSVLSKCSIFSYSGTTQTNTVLKNMNSLTY